MCMDDLFARMFLCHLLGPAKVRKKALELELHTVMSLHVGAKDWIRVF